MLYTAALAFYIARRAALVGFQYLCLSLLLALMVLFHGIHHLFAFLEYPFLESLFEFGASILALALAIDYAYLSRRQ
jgi:hypothetical protein